MYVFKHPTFYMSQMFICDMLEPISFRSGALRHGYSNYLAKQIDKTDFRIKTTYYNRLFTWVTCACATCLSPSDSDLVRSNMSGQGAIQNLAIKTDQRLETTHLKNAKRYTQARSKTFNKPEQEYVIKIHVTKVKGSN